MIWMLPLISLYEHCLFYRHVLTCFGLLKEDYHNPYYIALKYQNFVIPNKYQDMITMYRYNVIARLSITRYGNQQRKWQMRKHARYRTQKGPRMPYSQRYGYFFVLWFKNDPVIMRLDCAKERYKPVPQFSQCTRPISPNAPFCNRKVHTCAHFCHKMVHCVIFVGYNSVFVRCVYFFISVFFNWVIAVFWKCKRNCGTK